MIRIASYNGLSGFRVEREWRQKLLRASMEVASRVVVISRPERIVAGLVGWVRGLQRRGRI